VEEFFNLIKKLVLSGEIRVSEHGFDELLADDISINDIIKKVNSAKIVEFYPNYGKGKCILLLHFDQAKEPIHILWGIPKGFNKPAVLITAYKPDKDKWDSEYLNRKR